MRNLVEDLLLIGIKGKEGQILRIEQAQNVFVKVEQNLVEIVGGVNLIRDAFDVFRELNFSLQLLQVLRRRLGRHHSAPARTGTTWRAVRAGGRCAVAQLPHSDKSRLSLAQQDGKARKRRFHDARRRTT